MNAVPNVLVVEDEESFRELLVALLASCGYAVHTAVDAREAVRRLDQHAVDLVITDLCMPNMDGMELLTQLRSLRRAVPVIAISGGVHGSMGGMLQAARLLGATHTLAKPFPLEDLLESVRTLLRGWQTRAVDHRGETHGQR